MLINNDNYFQIIVVVGHLMYLDTFEVVAFGLVISGQMCSVWIIVC